MPLTAAHLRKLADEIDAEEAEAERERQEAETKAERDRLDEKLRTLDEKAAKVDDLIAKLEGDPAGEPPAPKPPAGEEKETRPGRKSGQAYDWDVDANGNVYDLDVATVWTGKDEPDEVEIEDDAP